MEILWSWSLAFCEQKIHSHVRSRLNNSGNRVRHSPRRRVLTRLLPACKYYLPNFGARFLRGDILPGDVIRARPLRGDS